MSGAQFSCEAASDVVLIYILRRVLYSIPVLLIASFLTFWGVRTTYDPLLKYRQSRNAAVLIPQKRHQLGLDQSIFVQWWRWFKGFLHGDMGVSSRTNDHVSSMLGHAMWPTLQLMFFGTIFALIIAIGIGAYSAVKQYSVGDYTFTGLSYVGIAMPPFVFGLLAIALLVTMPVAKFGLNEPIFYSIGLHGTGQSGFNMDYVRHLVAAGAGADGAEHRVVEPISTCVDARRAECRLRTNRPREGRAAAEGDLQARVSQCADSADDGRRARHRVPDRWPRRHRADLLDHRAWGACSSSRADDR